MQRDVQSERLSHLLFYGAVALLVWMGYRIAEPFFAEIGWALVLAVCLDPIRVRVQPKLGPTRAALVLSLLVVLLLVIPVLFVITTLVTEGGSAVSFVDAQLRRGTGISVIFHDAWQWLRERVPALPTEQEAIATITSSIGGAAKFFADSAGGVLKGVFNFVVSLGLTLVILFFLLRDWSNFATGVRRILPFGPRQNQELMDIAHALISASVTAALAIALVQAILGGITFAILGIKGAVLWAAMIGVLSFLPMVGATLVWLPAAVWLALSGSPTKGLILGLVGVLILGNVDNVVRPLLLSGKAQISTPVLIISLFGGLSAFGFIGVVIGPLVAALLTALVQSYQVTQFEAPVVFEGTGTLPSPPPASPVPSPESTAPPEPPPQA
jgi:predicted PurR-regulated permease PerM